MEGLVIATKDNDEIKFLTDLLEKLGVASSAVSEEELEDVGLSKMLKAVDRTSKVSRDSVIAKLQV